MMKALRIRFPGRKGLFILTVDAQFVGNDCFYPLRKGVHRILSTSTPFREGRGSREKFTGKFFRLTAFLFVLVFIFAGFTAAAADATMDNIIEEITPRTESTAVAGSYKTIRVLADRSAEVSVKVGGNSVKMSRTSESSKSGRYWFEGDYQIPSGGKNLTIVATASLNGRTQSRTGGSFTAIDAQRLPTESGGDTEPDTPSGETLTVSGNSFSGKQITVTARYADVYIPSANDRGEGYAAPYYYQLPKGTIDYVTSGPDGNGNYLLASGRKVASSKVSVTAKSGTQGDNTISALSLSADSQCTYLTVSEKWKVPFNIEVENITYAGSKSNTVSDFTPKKIKVVFDYTTSIPDTGVSIPSGSCFSSVKVSTRKTNGIAQCVVELTLQKGAYYGAYASYSGNKLQLKFYNPVSSLRGARIVIDSGHGSYTGAGKIDPGAIGVNSTQEAYENYRKATALRDELVSRGAEVYLLDTYKTSNLYSLYARVNAAIDWEPMVYVSCHHNSSATTSNARGIEVYYNNPWSVYLAKNICNNIFSAYKNMSNSAGAVNRGHKFSEYAVTRVKQFSAVLVEYGFITTPTENALLTDATCIQQFAEATADGLEAYFEGVK